MHCYFVPRKGMLKFQEAIGSGADPESKYHSFDRFGRMHLISGSIDDVNLK